MAASKRMQGMQAVRASPNWSHMSIKNGHKNRQDFLPLVTVLVLLVTTVSHSRHCSTATPVSIYFRPWAKAWAVLALEPEPNKTHLLAASWHRHITRSAKFVAKPSRYPRAMAVALTVAVPVAVLEAERERMSEM